MQLKKRALAELIGTFWLVFGGCGSAIIACGLPTVGIGFIGVALAFGLTVLTMAYAIGHISGCHLNPAVTLGLIAAGRFKGRDALAYIAAQLAGAILASLALYLVASGLDGFHVSDGFATNGFGDHSPLRYSMASCFVAEALLTAFFLFVIIGSTDRRAPAGLAPIAIGLTLTLIHLISIPITNTSVNPARSTGPALIFRGWSLEQLWLFWVAPILGALCAGWLYRSVFETAPDKK